MDSVHKEQIMIDSVLAEKWTRLTRTDHFEHEDIIRYLQDFPDPRSVPVLREAIGLKPPLKYLAYDDYGAYYKKCLWALQSIGTPEAIDLIREYAESGLPELRYQATHRLSRIAANKG